MRYFLGFLVAIGLIILVIILVVRALGGGNHNQTATPQTVLSDYADTATVMRLSIDDNVNADENHYTVRINVGRDEKSVEVVKGYQGKVVSSQSFGNNQEAYTVFLRALEFQGYTKGDTDPAKADERGMCPTNRRYIYEIISPGGADVQRLWNSECKVGTFEGNGSVIRTLFREQIPNYRTLVKGTGIS